MQDCESNAGAGAAENKESDSQDSSSESEKRQPTAADLKQLIHLQEDADMSDEEKAATRKAQGLLEPAFKEGYSLIFGTNHLYLVFKTIASIYERLVKAQQLISAKVDQDCERQEIKDVIGLSGEELTTFKQQSTIERFKLFINAVIGSLSQAPNRKLDPSNYEDIVRMIMGDQAYLLFVFDKLIMQVSTPSYPILTFVNAVKTLKNLPALKTNDECQRNLGLFTKFSKSKVQNEHLYLTQFQQ